MKRGPRAKRIAERDAKAAREIEDENFVRSQRTPELVAAAKKAIQAFEHEDRGKPRTR